MKLEDRVAVTSAEALAALVVFEHRGKSYMDRATRTLARRLLNDVALWFGVRKGCPNCGCHQCR